MKRGLVCAVALGLLFAPQAQASTIADLHDSVEALDLQQGIESSLLRKLQEAERKLGRGDVAGACDGVESFINEVNAQRGKKIEPAYADALVADAGQVRVTIGCAGAPTSLYVALGDSVTAPSDSYASLLFTHYQTTLGVEQLSNQAQGGTTSGSIRTAGGQLDEALADIDDASDTRVVTIGIGGNDLLTGCDFTNDLACPFRANFSATLADLQAALANDPGTESLIALAYYNPDVGEPNEAFFDDKILGDDLVRDCGASGADLGLNDVISQVAADHQALIADAYPAFKIGGQTFMADNVHPNALGHQAIADAFVNPLAPCVP